MPARRPVLIALTVGLAASAATVALPAMARPTTVAPTFSQPMVLLGGGAEPSIRVPGDGRSVAYVSAPTGAGSNFWRVTKKVNRDHSVTFVQSPVQQPDLGTGGGDSEISVATPNGQSNGCDTIAYSGLHNIDLLDNFTVATSTDCGKTFSLANPYGTQNTLTDRQWQVFDGAKTNFLIFHMVSTGQIVVTESPDGGAHYVSLAPDGAHGIIEPQLLAASGNTQQIGNIIVNRAERVPGKTNLLSGEPVHAMYAIFGLADDTSTGLESNAPGTTYNGLDDIYIGRSVDGGLTWTDSLVYRADPSTKRELNMLFPVITSDSAGNLYAAWSDTYKIQYAVSTDHGAHWSKPYQVNPDNRGWTKSGADRPDPGKADVFPWIAAGGPGLLDVVWYHGEGGTPVSNRVYRDPGDAKTKWTVAMAQLRLAARTVSGAAAPKVATFSPAITPVVHYGDICQNGTFCSLVPVSGAPLSTGDRSLLDFFQVAIDSDGRANVAIGDNATAPGQLISAFTQQLTGISLKTGRSLRPLHVSFPTTRCDAYGTLTDPAGDGNEVAVEAVPGANAPGVDIRKGWVTWNAAKKVATFHVTVSDLSQVPAGSTGVNVNFYFGWATKGYAVEATRDETTGTSFGLDSNGTAGRSGIVSGLTGSFDDAHNEVRINLPAAAFGKSSDRAFRAPAFATGASVTGLKVETRRSYPAALQPVSDTAAGACPATLGGGAHPSSGGIGGSGNPLLLPRAPLAHAQGLLESLGAAALFGLLAALVAGVVTRRRSFGLAVG